MLLRSRIRRVRSWVWHGLLRRPYRGPPILTCSLITREALKVLEKHLAFAPTLRVRRPSWAVYTRLPTDREKDHASAHDQARHEVCGGG